MGLLSALGAVAGGIGDAGEYIVKDQMKQEQKAADRESDFQMQMRVLNEKTRIDREQKQWETKFGDDRRATEGTPENLAFKKSQQDLETGLLNQDGTRAKNRRLKADADVAEATKDDDIRRSGIAAETAEVNLNKAKRMLSEMGKDDSRRAQVQDAIRYYMHYKNVVESKPGDATAIARFKEAEAEMAALTGRIPEAKPETEERTTKTTRMDKDGEVEETVKTKVPVKKAGSSVLSAGSSISFDQAQNLPEGTIIRRNGVLHKKVNGQWVPQK